MTPQELKNSILQLAIQGKLVDQRPEEGTAEELFKRLKVHHSGLKPCKDELDYSAMDFDIPESWKMIELNQLFDFIDYRGKTPNKISEGVFLITASNIKQGYMDYTRKEFISNEEYEGRQSRGVTQKGDLLFTTEAPMGNAALCDMDICSCGQRIITFKSFADNTAIPELFMYFILSSPFQKQLLCNCTGTTAKGIKADKLKHFLIPLPPLAEQKRIVAKIEELLPLNERYEKAWTRLEDFNKRFPSDMQKSILQMAIQGKLVEQRPEEGTGEELYQQIQKEKQAFIKAGKIKKEKPLPKISEDEVPFDIPESWKWVRFLSAVDIATNLVQPVEYSEYMHIAPDNIEKGTGKLLECRTVEEDEVTSANHLFFKGQIIYSKIRPLLRKAVIAPFDGLCSADMYPLNTQLDSSFLLHYLLSDTFNHQIALAMSSRVKMPKINQDELGKVLLPLPPLAEQKRIVARLEELLPLCERLK